MNEGIHVDIICAVMRTCGKQLALRPILQSHEVVEQHTTASLIAALHHQKPQEMKVCRWSLQPEDTGDRYEAPSHAKLYDGGQIFRATARDRERFCRVSSGLIHYGIHFFSRVL